MLFDDIMFIIIEYLDNDTIFDLATCSRKCHNLVMRESITIYDPFNNDFYNEKDRYCYHGYVIINNYICEFQYIRFYSYYNFNAINLSTAKITHSASNKMITVIDSNKANIFEESGSDKKIYNWLVNKVCFYCKHNINDI